MTSKKSPAAVSGGARFTMSFPSSLIEEPLMHKLSTDLKVMPNILRGRITAKSARLDIELTGKPEDIEKAVKYLEAKGVTLKKLGS